MTLYLTTSFLLQRSRCYQDGKRILQKIEYIIVYHSIGSSTLVLVICPTKTIPINSLQQETICFVSVD